MVERIEQGFQREGCQDDCYRSSAPIPYDSCCRRVGCLRFLYSPNFILRSRLRSSFRTSSWLLSFCCHLA